MPLDNPPSVQPSVPESADPPICQSRTPLTPVQGTIPVRFRPYRNSTAEDGARSSFQLALMREMVEMDILTKKFDAANRRIAPYEATQKTVLLNINVLINIARNIRSKSPDPIAPVTELTMCSLDDIPEKYTIGDEDLHQIVSDSRNAGNLVVNLCKKTVARTLRRRKLSVFLQMVWWWQTQQTVAGPC